MSYLKAETVTFAIILCAFVHLSLNKEITFRKKRLVILSTPDGRIIDAYKYKWDVNLNLSHKELSRTEHSLFGILVTILSLRTGYPKVKRRAGQGLDNMTVCEYLTIWTNSVTVWQVWVNCIRKFQNSYLFTLQKWSLLLSLTLVKRSYT